MPFAIVLLLLTLSLQVFAQPQCPQIVGEESAVTQPSPDGKFKVIKAKKYWLTLDEARDRLVTADGRVILRDIDLVGSNFSDDGNFLFFLDYDPKFSAVAGFNQAYIKRFNLNSLTFERDLKLKSHHDFERALDKNTYVVRRIDRKGLFGHGYTEYPGPLGIVDQRGGLFGLYGTSTYYEGTVDLREHHKNQFLVADRKTNRTLILTTRESSRDRSRMEFIIEVFDMTTGQLVTQPHIPRVAYLPASGKGREVIRFSWPYVSISGPDASAGMIVVDLRNGQIVKSP